MPDITTIRKRLIRLENTAAELLREIRDIKQMLPQEEREDYNRHQPKIDDALKDLANGRKKKRS